MRRRVGTSRSAARLAAALAILLLIATQAIAQAPTNISTCPRSGQFTPNGAWTSIKPPRFTVGAQEFVDYAVNPMDGDLVFITNGVQVMRSEDGGCRWINSYILPEFPSTDALYSEVDAQITSITAALASDGGTTLYLTVNQQLGKISNSETPTIAKPHVVASDDGGRTWRTSDSGLEGAIGEPVALGVSPVFSSVAYLLIADAGRAALYVTGDGGANWQQSSGLQDSLGGSLAGMSAISVEYTTPTTVYLYGVNGLLRSANGGATFARIDVAGDPISAFDPGASQSVGQPPGLMEAFSAVRSVGFVSRDGGGRWTPAPTPGTIRSAGRWLAQVRVVANSNEAIVQFDEYPGFDIHLPGSVTDVQTSVLDGFLAIYARAGDTLQRAILQFNNTFNFPPPKQTIADVVIPAVEPKLVKPTLSPHRINITLGRGETKTVHYALELPHTPTPLDVYFLVDISGSMTDTINGVRRAMAGIYRRLVDEGIDVWFGVGEYRSYDDPPAYSRVLGISPPGRSLEYALESLYAEGGGLETQLEALYQSATGEGRQVSPFGYISSNQQANFRTGTLRVIVHATDEPFSTGGSHPTYEKVAAALNAHSVDQVGLAIEGGLSVGIPPDPESPAVGLERVARDTNTLAPPGGVDCDGDGRPELAEGQPLVCVLASERSADGEIMAAAISNLVSNLEDVAAVEVEANGPSRVVRDVSEHSFPEIDFHDYHLLPFSVTYGCPRVKKERTFSAELLTSARGRELATATAKITCTIKHKQAPPPIPPIPLRVILPPPVAPASVAPNPNPQGRPNPQSNPQSQSAFQSALAAQEQDEIQVAVAQAYEAEGVSLAGNEEYYMVSQRQTRGSPIPLYAAGAALCMASGIMLHLRRRHEVVVARARRR